MAETVLFICAHNDDQIVGAGGTIAKYAKEGKKIVTVIFSFGEFALFHLDEKVSKKTRVKESKRAAKLLGESELYYLGLKEGHFKEGIEEKDINSKIKAIIKRIKPSKVFSHSMDDPHPDHRDVYTFTAGLLEEINYKGDFYSFNVWNLFLNFRRRDLPKLVVDITDTFKIKVEAFRKHKSQQINAILPLMWNVYVQAVMHGFNNHVRYAEVFYKIR
ncbi:PIG-L family deacetylase [Candidatus Woesearchaeota archaeon]|nr:PIG-L family deacetylase [Candidatus Woesearchaeota archaeon]